jgi:hypothetical protein
MPFITTSSRRIGRVLVATCGLALLVAAPAAQAATTAANPQNCVPQPALKQAFLPWGDGGQYTLSPGGDLESAPAGWLLSGGARIVAGNEPFYVGHTNDKASLSLPAGSSVVTSPICIDDTYPWFRVFARNNSGQAAGLNVEILYLDTTGKLRTRASGMYNARAGSGWAPTGTLKIPMTFDPTTAGGAAPVAFRFTPQGTGSSWQIDDVYVDPMARR